MRAMIPGTDSAPEKIMLSHDLLYEFEKGLNSQKPAQAQIPAGIVGYGEISAIFEIEADKHQVYKRLPLFDSLAAARHYQQMYLDCFFRTAAPGPVFHHPAIEETLRVYSAGQNQTLRNPYV